MKGCGSRMYAEILGAFVSVRAINKRCACVLMMMFGAAFKRQE